MGSVPSSRPGAGESRDEGAGGRAGRALEVMIATYGSIVFVVLWIHVAQAILTDGQTLADAWSWLSGLDTVTAVIVWILLLPVAIFVWAWQADLAPALMALVMVGLVVWTAVAWSGLIRVLRRRRRSAA